MSTHCRLYVDSRGDIIHGCGALPPHGIRSRDRAGTCAVRGLMIGGRVRCMTPPPWSAGFLGFPGVKSGDTR